MSSPAPVRIHWMIAWRHLRAGDRAPSFIVPLMVIAVYLIVVGAGFLGAAAMSAPPPPPIPAPIVPELAIATTPAADVASYFGLVGGATLFVGVMMLIGGILSRIFTLLATVIIISVMLGCMALVIVLSLMTGLEVELRDKILGQLSHIRIDREDHRPFADYTELTDRVAATPGVVGASPYLQGEVMVRNGLNRQGGILTGIIPERHAGVSYLPTIVVEGKYEHLDHPERIPDPSFSFDIVADPPAIAPRAELPIKVIDDHDDDDDDDDAIATTGTTSATAATTTAATTTAATTTAATTTAATVDLPPEPTFGTLPLPIPTAPPRIPRTTVAADEDAGWEDPEVEIERLRELGELPPARAEDDDAWGDEVAAPKPRKGRGKGGVVDDPGTGERHLKRKAKAPVEPEDDEGWEDPEAEIARLRAAGELPPAGTAGAGQGGEATAVVEGPAEVESSPTVVDPEGEDAPAVLSPVLIGNEKARELIAHVGDRVQLITPIGRSTPAGRIPGVMAVRVGGVFDAEHYEYDRWLVYAPLGVVQAFLRTGDRISGIEVKVDDLKKVGERKKAIQKILEESGRTDLRVRDWQELNASLFSAMALEKLAVFIALLCVILVASFGILGSNLMSVLEKSKEIAILKTMGCSDSLIQRVFIAEGLCMGILGGIMGISTGIALCMVLDRYGLPLSGNLHGFEKLPVSIDPVEVAVVGVSALVIVWLSSLYPARVASRMRPVEALRKAEA